MANGFTFRDGQLTLAKQAAPLAIRWSRPLPAGVAPSSVTVTRTTGGKYYLSFLVEEDIAPLPAKRREVGIDLNTQEIVCSNGQRFGTPAQLKALEHKRRRYQRACKQQDCCRESGTLAVARCRATERYASADLQ